MIDFFLLGTLILGQLSYWFFFRYQTAAITHEYWKAHALRFRIARVAAHRMRLLSQMNKQGGQEGLHAHLHDLGDRGDFDISNDCWERQRHRPEVSPLRWKVTRRDGWRVVQAYTESADQSVPRADL